MICFRYSRFALNEGERIVDYQIRIHGVTIHVDGPAGPYRVAENEIFRTPARPGLRVHQENGASVFRSRGRPTSYVFLARTPFSPNRDRMIAVISGDALSGGIGDGSVYRRLAIGDSSSVHCDQSYLYGLEALLGDVPAASGEAAGP